MLSLPKVFEFLVFKISDLFPFEILFGHLAGSSASAHSDVDPESG